MTEYTAQDKEVIARALVSRHFKHVRDLEQALLEAENRRDAALQEVCGLKREVAYLKDLNSGIKEKHDAAVADMQKAREHYASKAALLRQEFSSVMDEKEALDEKLRAVEYRLHDITRRYEKLLETGDESAVLRESLYAERAKHREEIERYERLVEELQEAALTRA